MLINHNNMVYAFEQATGEFGVHVPGTEPPDDTNPKLACKKTDRTSPLSQLILEVSQQCNLRCEYCQYTHGGVPGMRGHREVYMDSATAEAAMRIWDERGAGDGVICFYGGEALMNIRLIREVVEKRPHLRYQIDSNGVWIGEEIAEWAAQFNIDWQISLDGDARATNRYRGVHTFGLARAGIRTLKFFKPDVSVRIACTLTPPWRIDEAAACFEDSQMKDLPLTVSIVDLTGCTTIEPEPFPWAKYRDIYREMVIQGRRDQIPRLIRQLFERDLVKFYHRKVGRFAKWVPGGCCDPGVRRLFVDAEGALFPCERTCGAHQIGTVEDGIDWTAVDQMHRMFHVERRDKGCEDCEILRLCGGCWVTPINCEWEKARVREVAKLYADLHEAGAAEWLRDTEVV